MVKSDDIWVIIGIIFFVCAIILEAWFTITQWNLCMSMFNDWFYCLKHIS